MNSFTLPYIHSGPGFPIVLVGTFNKAKDIKAPSLNIVFREIVSTPLRMMKATLGRAKCPQCPHLDSGPGPGTSFPGAR